MKHKMLGRMFLFTKKNIYIVITGHQVPKMTKNHHKCSCGLYFKVWIQSHYSLKTSVKPHSVVSSQISFLVMNIQSLNMCVHLWDLRTNGGGQDYSKLSYSFRRRMDNFYDNIMVLFCPLSLTFPIKMHFCCMENSSLMTNKASNLPKKA